MPEGQAPTLEELTTKYALQETEVQALKRIMDAGELIPKPQRLDQLPKELQDLVDQAAKARTDAEVKIARDQLYKTIAKAEENFENERKRNEGLAAAAAKAEADAEAARIAALPVEQKLAEIQRIQQEEVSRVQTSADTRITKLENELRIARLNAVRSQVIAEANGEIFPELVRSPDLFTNLSEDEIRNDAVVSKQRYAAHLDAMRQRLTAEQTAAGAAQQQQQAGGKTQSQESILSRLVPQDRMPMGGAPVTITDPNSLAGVQGGIRQVQRQDVSSAASGFKQLSPEEYQALPPDKRKEYRDALSAVV